MLQEVCFARQNSEADKEHGSIPTTDIRIVWKCHGRVKQMAKERKLIYYPACKLHRNTKHSKLCNRCSLLITTPETPHSTRYTTKFRYNTLKDINSAIENTFIITQSYNKAALIIAPQDDVTELLVYCIQS